MVSRNPKIPDAGTTVVVVAVGWNKKIERNGFAKIDAMRIDAGEID
jgi:hypothetical protein